MGGWGSGQKSKRNLDWAEVRAERLGGKTYAAIGAKFGVSKQRIFQICAGLERFNRSSMSAETWFLWQGLRRSRLYFADQLERLARRERPVVDWQTKEFFEGEILQCDKKILELLERETPHDKS